MEAKKFMPPARALIELEGAFLSFALETAEKFSDRHDRAVFMKKALRLAGQLSMIGEDCMAEFIGRGNHADNS